MTMETTLPVLLLTALTTGVVHTILGPDHTVPLIALARDRAWTPARTLGLTLACGLFHLASAGVLAWLVLMGGLRSGLLGLSEATWASTAGWLLVGLGAAYALWGLRRALGSPRPRATGGEAAFSWALFLVFILGPCEPLIPLLLWPAGRGDLGATVLTFGVFGLATLGTMVLTVGALTFGLRRWTPGPRVTRFGSLLAGLAIGASGLAVAVGGL